MEYITYNGQKLPTITEGFWPDGVTLACCDKINSNVRLINNVYCLHNSVADYILNGRKLASSPWVHWAIIPPNPPDRRLSNLEVANLCRQGWTVLNEDWVLTTIAYYIDKENEPCEEGIKIRKPNSNEWINPTVEETKL